MNLFAKDQPEREYQAPTATDEARSQARIIVTFMAGKYQVIRGAGQEKQTVESGPIAPQVEGWSREDDKAREIWTNELIERVRGIAQTEKLSFNVSQGFSSLESADYR